MRQTMRQTMLTSLLRGAVCAGMVSCPLLAAEAASPDSGAGNFWSLVLGLMFTIFGGMAFCFGLVKLGETVVHRFQARHLPHVSEPPMRRAA